MNRKRMIGLGVLAGSTAGGYLPSLWGAGAFSMSGIFFGMIGGLVGVWFGYRYGD